MHAGIYVSSYVVCIYKHVCLFMYMYMHMCLCMHVLCVHMWYMCAPVCGVHPCLYSHVYDIYAYICICVYGFSHAASACTYGLHVLSVCVHMCGVCISDIYVGGCECMCLYICTHVKTRY